MNTEMFSNGHHSLNGGRNKKKTLNKSPHFNSGFPINSPETVCTANFHNIRKCSNNLEPAAPGCFFFNIIVIVHSCAHPFKEIKDCLLLNLLWRFCFCQRTSPRVKTVILYVWKHVAAAVYSILQLPLASDPG